MMVLCKVGAMGAGERLVSIYPVSVLFSLILEKSKLLSSVRSTSACHILARRSSEPPVIWSDFILGGPKLE